jgi:hypothetical protein
MTIENTVPSEELKALVGPQRPFLLIEIGGESGVPQEKALVMADAFYERYQKTHQCEQQQIILSGDGRVMMICFATRLDILYTHQSRMGAASAHGSIEMQKEAQRIQSGSIAMAGGGLPPSPPRGTKGAFG